MEDHTHHMAGLQRSEISFRRQGSSGLVWDDKFLSGELKQIKTKDEDDDDDEKEKEKVESREQHHHTYRTIKVEPTTDPPSPKVSAACGLCSIFAKQPLPAHKPKSDL